MNKTCKISVLALSFIAAAATLLNAHPHFRKTVLAKLPDVEVKLEYTTYPWNPSHLSEVKEGFIFHCGNALVEISKAVKIGSTEIAAGKYQLRARAKDVDHWTFFLVPPPPDRSTPPDMTKAIDLTTRTLTGRPIADHLSLDIAAGHGDTDGRALFVLAWGERQLEGELADFAGPKN